MKPLRISLFLLLLVGCTLPPGTYSINLIVPEPIVIGISPTPLEPTVSILTPTQEVGAIFAPKWTPAPNAFVVYEVTARPNLRSSAGLRNPDGTLKDNKIGILDDGQLVELDPRIFIEADGYIWRQVFSHTDGSLLGWVAENWLQVYRA